jgi:predicted PurR-regulated permease PerM
MSMLPARGLVRAALTCTCLLVLAFTAWLVAYALMDIVVVTASAVAALLLSALLLPLTTLLRRAGLPDWAAALLTIVIAVGAIGGLVTLLVTRVQAQQSDLQSAVADSVQQLRHLVLRSPLPISASRLDVGAKNLSDAAVHALPGPAAGANMAVQVLSALVLTVFLWFFLLKDGRAMWEWAVGWAPARHRARFVEATRTVWDVVTGYIHGTTVIAAVDALGIGAAMLALGVPLTASLTILVFIGAFIPIVGAFVSGALAVGVTLVTQGPVSALVLFGCVVLVQQLEGNLLQPLVMGRALRLHPVVIVTSVTIGALVGGVLGAVVVVPLVAVAYRLALQVRGQRHGSATGERVPADR